MSTTIDQPNKGTPTNQDHAFPPPVVAYAPQPFNGATYPTPPPPGSYPPPFFAYPPPQDASHSENGQGGIPPPAPYMISFPPPGVVYAFPPPQGQVAPGGPVSAPPALTKPKRKQVKMACTNCAAACKRCDEGRPCERCQKYGIGDSCRDGQRKERKKGVKRGPYKRKNKNGDSEWTPAQAATGNPNAPMPVAQFSSPEGYYGPIYYPTPGTFLTHPAHEVPSGQDGAVPANGQPPIMPYFLPAYSPYPPPYGHPAMYPGMPPGAPQPQQQAQPQAPQLVQPQQTVQQSASRAVDVSAGSGESSSPGSKKKKDEGPSVSGSGPSENPASGATGSVPGGTATSKKRKRGVKGGESKTKKAKTLRNGDQKEGEGSGDGGTQLSPA